MSILLRLVLGAIFTLLGVLGSILPILPGWIFFLLTALVLFPKSRFAERSLARVESRAPRLVAWLRRAGIG